MEEIKERSWHFDNSYAQLPQVFYANTNPTVVRLPKLIMFNHALAITLGLGDDEPSDDDVAVFAGNRIPEDAFPLAQAYAGHQFGHFTMLGDGRAILLGEQITPANERMDIQLKGAGRTPYSRGGDGRATLGSMLREYIISEAMYGLGIPTSRSLAVVTTGESVARETNLPGAILTRVSTSHLRVGTFEYAAKWSNAEELQQLADYTIKRHFPAIEKYEHRYLALLHEVVKRQASLIANWQLVGFIHGVMNTDNMALSGESIDYGPCAFMDDYHPATVFSSIDRQGRYAYSNQPIIGGWNLARFAETLLPLLAEDQDEAVKLAQETVSDFRRLYQNNWLAGMRAKLGMFNEEEGDEPLIQALLDLMAEHKADFTNTFLSLTFNKQDDTDLYATSEFAEWLKQWRSRLTRQEQSKEDAHQLMCASNPAVIARNHRVEEVLAAAVEKQDYRGLEQLLNVLSAPYGHTAEQQEYAALPIPSNEPYQTYCGT